VPARQNSPRRLFCHFCFSLKFLVLRSQRALPRHHCTAHVFKHTVVHCSFVGSRFSVPSSFISFFFGCLMGGATPLFPQSRHYRRRTGRCCLRVSLPGRFDPIHRSMVRCHGCALRLCRGLARATVDAMVRLPAHIIKRC